MPFTWGDHSPWLHALQRSRPPLETLSWAGCYLVKLLKDDQGFVARVIEHLLSQFLMLKAIGMAFSWRPAPTQIHPTPISRMPCPVLIIILANSILFTFTFETLPTPTLAPEVFIQHLASEENDVAAALEERRFVRVEKIPIYPSRHSQHLYMAMKSAWLARILVILAVGTRVPKTDYTIDLEEAIRVLWADK
ncbi:hypothetical protein JAAARDRAFT_211130 [Jaapia argillacea MUCL 33604]|uniref:Uncharacterized protein n=1 Tax=Jaapia argillacea MUCL 33604 TaxID=933084 RepID=A0A067PLL6_9AGAM|nr:hypothetical protein JAAARDRAFT_211130 [Jaapia argillacea MUCL 33604]